MNQQEESFYVPWSIKMLIHDVWHLSSFCDTILFGHVFQEANFLADALADLGHGLSSSFLWETGLPLSVALSFLTFWACVPARFWFIILFFA